MSCAGNIRVRTRHDIERKQNRVALDLMHGMYRLVGFGAWYGPDCDVI